MGNSISTDPRWARHDSLAPCLQKNSAYTKWLGLRELGHPLVHVLMKCLSRGGAPRIPADFWVEHKKAYAYYKYTLPQARAC